ncbi:hypothetical protein Q3A66_17110 [Hymenobacter sp. BT770]|uniref:hypothetical protein n=1 Tax=Hymenobacter sp. BT770 TaxID=2886942 RepID=UPI001D10E1C9|nr:hypothetical protein [Hymenobacter sp. BT770]MCC3154835.1 hypothetical protein [Hymenobacter sp. BT770]MDO3416790.1 hypothetical protein [Hymenobacter sp. BT770]
MRSLFRFLILLFLTLPAAAQKYNTPLGTAPAGFRWQALPDIKAAMPLPEGWYYKADGQKGATTYFLTRDEIGESGEFQPGASLNVVRKVKAKTGRQAADYAELLMLRTGFGPGQQQLDKTSSVDGPFYKRAVRYREAPPEAEPRVVYQMALANAKTDTLYLLTFESPEKDWADAWKLGEVMLRELVLDARL